MAPEPRESRQASDDIRLENLRPLSVASGAGTVKNFSRPFDSRTNLAAAPARDDFQTLRLPDRDLAAPPQAVVIERNPPDQISEDTLEAVLYHINPPYAMPVSRTSPDPDGYDDESTSRMAILSYESTRPRLPIPLTPAALPDVSIASPLSHGQLKELDRINRHERSEEPRLLVRWHDMVPDEPADGGKIAWWNVVCGFIIAMNTLGFNMAFGVFQTFYEKNLLAGEDRAKIVLIGSFQQFAMFMMSVITPPIVTRGIFRGLWGWLRPLTVGGAFTLLMAHAIISVCSTWWPLFIFQGVVTGLAMGIVFHSAMAALTLFFSTRLGAATCICMAGASVGGILYTLLLGHLFPKLGFSWTMRVVAGFNLLTMLPASKGLERRFSWPSPTVYRLNRRVFRDLPFVTMAIGMFFTFWGLYFGFYFMISYAQDTLTMTPTTSLNLLLATNTSTLLGRLLPSLLSDSLLGPMQTLIATTFLASAALLAWTSVSSRPAIFTLSCLYGLAASGVENLYVPTVFSYAGTDRRVLGARMAVVAVVVGVACLTGPPVAARLVSFGEEREQGEGEGRYGYVFAQAFAGGAVLFGGAALLAARVARAWRL